MEERYDPEDSKGTMLLAVFIYGCVSMAVIAAAWLVWGGR